MTPTAIHRSSAGRPRAALHRLSPLYCLLLCAILTSLACAGAEEEGSHDQEPGQLTEESESGVVPSHPRFRVQRAIEPPPGSALTTDIPRAQIGAEARTVLAAAPAAVLRWSERVELTGDLELEIELPAELTGARWLRIDSWVSVRNPDLPAETVAQLRTGGRMTLRAEPLILAGVAGAGDGGRAVVKVSVPESIRGRTGYLNVIARSLASSHIQRHQVGPFEIGPRARLDFGYGVEVPGWDEGWPPVHFRVSTEAGSGVGAEILFERRIDPAGDPRDRRWFDASLDLSRFAGHHLRFVFEAEALGEVPGAAVARSFPVVSNPEVIEVSRADRSAPGRPNLILISLDTLRARNVSGYGYARPTTPTLDRRVAGRGALVRTVVAPYPYTPPSHMTMLTGLEPCAHGVIDRHGVLDGERVTLAELLRAAGYQTAAFTENGYVVAGAGFERGFDTYVEQRSEEEATPGYASQTVGAAEEWLAASPAQPFFLFIHTYQVHAPYDPPRGYRSLFHDASKLEKEPGRGAAKREKARQRAQNQANYDREIRYTDDVLAGLLDHLDVRGLADSTVFVVTSDHGEGFGEHYWGQHGFSVHDEAILVPLMLRAPGLVEPGLVIEHQVGLVDLTPTLLELVGVSVPAEIQGQSFAGLLTGKGGTFEERPLISRASALPLESVRTRQYKYIHSLDTDAPKAYYDLESDSDERENLVAKRREAVAAADAARTSHGARCAEWRERHPARGRGEHYIENKPGWIINRDEIDEKLRSLGYLE